MKDESVLVPIDEQNVDFYGDEIVTALVKVEDHFQMYVPLRPICKYLGLTWLDNLNGLTAIRCFLKK